LLEIIKLMNPIEIILCTISIVMLVEALFIILFPGEVTKNIKRIFKNKKQTLRIGLIEAIIALLILFIVFL